MVNGTTYDLKSGFLLGFFFFLFLRVLLISCLLIGSITCGPVAKGKTTLITGKLFYNKLLIA